MSWAETIPGFGGLILAAYAAVRQKRHEDREERERKTADVTARIEREPSRTIGEECYIAAENLGPAAAMMVNIEVRTEGLSPEEIQRLPHVMFENVHLPIPHLDPGEKVRLYMIVVIGSGRSIPIHLSWMDAAGTKTKNLLLSVFG